MARIILQLWLSNRGFRPELPKMFSLLVLAWCRFGPNWPVLLTRILDLLNYPFDAIWAAYLTEVTPKSEKETVRPSGAVGVKPPMGEDPRSGSPRWWQPPWMNPLVVETLLKGAIVTPKGKDLQTHTHTHTHTTQTHLPWEASHNNLLLQWCFGFIAQP